MKKTILKLTFIIAIIAIITSCGGGTTKPVENKATKTIENVKAAIKGETTASAKYAAYAAKAKEEGFIQIAKLFEAASKSESIHAANHTKVLTDMGEKMDEVKPAFDVKSTKENLEDAIKGETYETTTMYPDFIKVADEEKADNASLSFSYAFQTEKKHLAFYQNALKALDAKDFSTLAAEYYVCPKCGNTYDNLKVAEFCEICGTAKDKFIVIK